MTSNKKNKIDKPHVILCEGRDAKYFLIWYLCFLEKINPVFKKFCVYDFGGVNELPQFFKSFSMQSDFRKTVKSVSVIRDGEKDFKGACDSVKEAFKKCQFNMPDRPFYCITNSKEGYNIKTGFILFPKISSEPQNGALEDLCLQILSKSDASALVEKGKALLNELSDEAGMKLDEKFPRKHKNQLSLYFSMTDDFTFCKIGEAAKAGAFDFQHSALTPLKEFLLKMAS